jgi:hypothetical protein
MNVVKYVFGFFGWKQSEQVPVPISDSAVEFVINVDDEENIIEPKLSLMEFIKSEKEREKEREPSSESDFDQKIMNRKNYNQKNKLRKSKRR